MTSASFPWEEQFRESAAGFIELGDSPQRAQALLDRYIELSHKTPLPPALDFSEGIEQLQENGPYLARDEEILIFMRDLLTSLLSGFELTGIETIDAVHSLYQEVPVVMIANHLSLFDAAMLYALLYEQSAAGKDLAESVIFIGGRVIFVSDYSRVASRMFNMLLVSSQKDMAAHPQHADYLKRLNMLSFREAGRMNKEGRILILFPEGTRSRDGSMGPFQEAVYNYLNGKVVWPIGLVGSEKILKAETYTFRAAQGSMNLGQPVFVGKKVPDAVQAAGLDVLRGGRREVMDILGQRTAALLPESQRGPYK